MKRKLLSVLLAVSILTFVGCSNGNSAEIEKEPGTTAEESIGEEELDSEEEENEESPVVENENSSDEVVALYESTLEKVKEYASKFMVDNEEENPSENKSVYDGISYVRYSRSDNSPNGPCTIISSELEFDGEGKIKGINATVELPFKDSEFTFEESAYSDFLKIFYEGDLEYQRINLDVNNLIKNNLDYSETGDEVEFVTKSGLTGRLYYSSGNISLIINIAN